jgi:hypothetical protein
VQLLQTVQVIDEAVGVRNKGFWQHPHLHTTRQRLLIYNRLQQKLQKTLVQKKYFTRKDNNLKNEKI